MFEKTAVTLLIVEDDEIDYMGIRRALSDLRIANPLVRAFDGVDALEYLRGENGKQKIPRPYMILLDLNMPRMGGLEFLSHIRDDEDLHDSVVFILTTSTADNDIFGAYQHNIAGYIVKSDARESFMEAARLLDCYWTIVALPTALQKRLSA